MKVNPYIDLKTTAIVVLGFVAIFKPSCTVNAQKIISTELTSQTQALQFDYQGSKERTDSFEYSGALNLRLDEIAQTFNDWDDNNGDIYQSLTCADIKAEIYLGPKPQACETLDLLGEGSLEIRIK